MHSITMTSKIQSLFMAVVFCATLFGCKNDNKVEDRYSMKSSYYVQTYIAADDFELKDVGRNGNFVVAIVFKGERISILPPTDKARFAKLAESYGDGFYTGTVTPGANKVLADVLTSVGVVCDRGYDAEHVAGCSLGDIVLFCATSPYDFIQGGYKDTVKDEDYPDYWDVMGMNRDIGYKPVEIPVRDVNEGNSLMLYPTCHLYFRKRPVQDGEYVFTVTINTGSSEIVKRIALR